MDYKETVNLPQTPFPMQADLQERQERMLRRWQAQDIYRALLEDRRDARPFIIHDGPPYASGAVHVGIGLNKVLKDIVAKYQAMNDRRVAFVPGWDCHGLPIEQEVRQEQTAGSTKNSVLEVRGRCERAARHYVDRQKRLFELLGIFADWRRPYLTMSPAYEAGVLDVFLQMVEKGYVFRDLRPVAWCTSCRTALAEAEIEPRSVAGHSLWLDFEGPPDLAVRCSTSGAVPCSLLVWTTTLWSLPGNTAVAAHPDLQYTAFAHKDGQGREKVSVLLEELAPAAFDAMGVKEYWKVGSVAGRDLEGLAVAHPLFEREVPVVLSEQVSADKGTGFVHLAPGHGEEDFAIARRFGLDIHSLLDVSGRFTSEAEGFSGMELEEAEVAILDALKQRGTLSGAETAEHEQPHCDRCHKPVITRATQQWFVRLDHRESDQTRTLRERALLEVEVTGWLPAGSRERMRGMLESRPDWCISRQRSWGVPLPAFICQSCGAALLNPTAIRRVRDLVGEHGSDIWFEKAVEDFVPSGCRCPGCGAEEFTKGEDILDVWFESGSSWQAVLVADHRSSFPADLYLEGTDQHRGWFQLSLLPSLVSRGRAPFRNVFTHGFVLNQDRRRMSRSRGDLVTLTEALDKVPADLIRLFFASVDVSTDIPLSIDSFSSVETQYRTLRNTFRFLLGNLHDFDPREHTVHLEDLRLLDLWALCRFHVLVGETSEDFASYRFHQAVRRIHEFCNDFLSRLYFDALKDCLYCDAAGSLERRSAQTVLHSMLVGLAKILAPVIPYTTEEVWDLTPGHGDCASVHLSRWPRVDETLLHTKKSQDAEGMFAQFHQLRRAVAARLEMLREAKEIGESTDARVELFVEGGLARLLGRLTVGDLRSFLRVAEVVESDGPENLEAITGLRGVLFRVEASGHPLCVRCRQRDAACGEDAEHPGLCRRCAAVINGLGSPPARLQPILGPIEPTARPADLAKFLRTRDIRKVALLNEGGICRPWALHPASQEIRLLPELQPLADHVNQSPDFRDHAALLLGLGEHTDVLFGIGIHHLNYGTPLGGTREFPYTQVSQLLDNLLRLSWGMSVKNAIAELPHGGGKSIIDTCGLDLKIHRELRRDVYRDFGQFTASLFGRYICAEDVGNTTADTREMLSSCRHVMCLSQGVGGSGNPSRFTSLAAWAAAKAGWSFLTGRTSWEGLTIALQGCGNVGRNLVSILIEADPGIERLLVGDRDPEQIQVIRNLLLKRDLGHILEVVSSRDPLQEEPYAEREDEKGKEYILYTPCDILIPAAVGNVIHPDNVERLRCQLILPIANNIYSDNDAVARALLDLGIVDVVENNVNWGGALAAASEILGYDERNVAQACIEAYEKTLRLLQEAQERNRAPWEIIKERASRRIFEKVHPAVAASRKYKFIGDVSQNFPSWIKERWLSSAIDVEPDQFPHFAISTARNALKNSIPIAG